MEPESETGTGLPDPAARVLPLIDLTSLGDDDTDDRIVKLCNDATTDYGAVAAVCVWPRFVRLAVSVLDGAPVGIAAVANFPDGSVDPDRAVDDATSIVAAGGTEVDVVYPWRALAGGDETIGPELVAATRSAVGSDIALKVILETGELGEERLIRQAATHAIDAGADFLKTSTGKTAHAATPEAARFLLETVRDSGRPIGVKIAGGIRTVAVAADYLTLADEIMGPDWVGPGTFRFGASGLLGDVLGTAGAAGGSDGY
ncbi:MAG: deoxyribose-phosphate aldolase [Actinomycetota bacterium]